MKYLLTADWHLMNRTPRCRTDNFGQAQWDKVEWIFNLAREQNAIILIAGDLFDGYKMPLSLINNFVHQVKAYDVNIIACAGNHDLPGHNLKSIDRSAIGNLFASKVIGDWDCDDVQVVHFGQEIDINTDHNILVYHELMWHKKKPFPNAPDEGNARTFFKKYSPHFDLILTGDNHQTFVLDDDCDRYMVNPGSIFRTTADQAQFKPSVFIYDDVMATLYKHFIPIEKDVISRDHIEMKKDKDNRHKAFIKRMKTADLKLDFRENMEIHCSANKIDGKVKELIEEAMDI